MVTTVREPRAYEIMAIFPPDLADEDISTQLDRASGYITSAGGTIKEILTDSPWGRRRLAYPIRFNSQDVRDGFYAVYHFDLPPSAMSDVERELKLDSRVMRYLVVHDDPKVGERNKGRTEAQGEEGASEAGETAATAAEATAAPVAGETAASSTEATVPAEASEVAPASDPAAGDTAEAAVAPPAQQPEPATGALAETDAAAVAEATESTAPDAGPEPAVSIEAQGTESTVSDSEPEAAPVGTSAPATDDTEGDAREENDA